MPTARHILAGLYLAGVSVAAALLFRDAPLAVALVFGLIIAGAFFTVIFFLHTRDLHEPLPGLVRWVPTFSLTVACLTQLPQLFFGLLMFLPDYPAPSTETFAATLITMLLVGALTFFVALWIIGGRLPWLVFVSRVSLVLTLTAIIGAIFWLSVIWGVREFERSLGWDDEFAQVAAAYDLLVLTYVAGLLIYSIYLRPYYRKALADSPRCSVCGYNMTGNLAAGSETCPECGTQFQVVEE